MEFKRVARSGQVTEGIVRRFYADDYEFAISRLDGKAYATSNYCSHLDCLLSSGKLVQDGIGCSCHGSAFDLETGEPICPPATEPISIAAARAAKVTIGDESVLQPGVRIYPYKEVESGAELILAMLARLRRPARGPGRW